MLYPHFTYIEKVFDAVSAGKITHHFYLHGRLDVLVRGEVIGHKHDPVGIEDRFPLELLELLDGYRGGNVITQGDIYIQ